MDVLTSRHIRCAVPQQSLGDLYVLQIRIYPRAQAVPERVEPESLPFFDNPCRDGRCFRVIPVDHLTSPGLAALRFIRREHKITVAVIRGQVPPVLEELRQAEARPP